MAAPLPTGPRGRLLALGLTALAAAVLWLGLIGPVLAWYAERAELAERQGALVRRMAALAESLPALRARAEAAPADPAPDALLADASDAVAGATLQARVQELASRASTTLASAESLPAEQLGAFRRISLRVTLTAPWPALVELLRALDAASPRMLVDDLQVQPAPAMQLAGRPLGATLTVLAFRAAAAAPVASR